MERKDFEIMAPVGSRESLAAAIHAGANSVYFGIGKLNMRAHSANAFGIDDLKEIASICHENGLKSYLTVNTIIYGEDIETMHEIVDAAKEAKISAVIASDVAVMTYCRKIGQEVHLSTQLNISNIRPDCGRAHLRSKRKSHSHRNVLPRRTLHGNKRKVLSQPEQCKQKRKQGRLHSVVQTRI